MAIELAHYILSFVTTILLGVVGFFLNRIIHELDDSQKEVQKLRERVAVLLDRDRQRRLSDYEAWDSEQ